MKIYQILPAALLLPMVAFVDCTGTAAGGGGSGVAPTVTLTSPLNLSTDFALNDSITVTFSGAMSSSSINTTSFTLATAPTVGNPVPVVGTVSLVGNVAIFKPTSNLSATTKYTATLTTGVKNSSGTALESNYTFSFTTSASINTTPPAVSATNPASSATGVGVNASVTATFGVAMDPSTITSTTFTLMQGATAVPGTVTVLNNVAIFTPTNSLSANTVYTATISTGAKDLAGNALASNKVWSFTTGSVTAIGPAPVDLGSAASFAILTKTGVTDVPASIITGDVGASPITGAAILLTCTEVSGTIFSVDAAGPLPCRVTSPVTLTTNIGDMQVAYADAAARTNPTATELGAGEIGGMTITPGLYKWSSNVLASSDVTLSGGANDVWIFQIAGDFDLANGIHVNLSGGAQASNIYWQIGGGTGVALGTTSQMVGTILAVKAITLGTGATINGRLLGQTNVTLQMNTVTLP